MGSCVSRLTVGLNWFYLVMFNSRLPNSTYCREFDSKRTDEVLYDIIDVIMDEVRYKTIGLIHSPFIRPRGTPIQPAGAEGIDGTVEVFPQYAGGLKDLEGFSHLILVYHFHLSKPPSLVVRPYMDSEAHGVFAMRVPSRPNPIGISVVRLTKVKENVLYIQDMDIVDGTPLLDIKPYVPEFDTRRVTKKGWLSEKVGGLSTSRDDGRFVK